MENLKCVCGAPMVVVKGASRNGTDVYHCLAFPKCIANGDSYDEAIRLGKRQSAKRLREIRRFVVEFLSA